MSSTYHPKITTTNIKQYTKKQNFLYPLLLKEPSYRTIYLFPSVLNFLKEFPTVWAPFPHLTFFLNPIQSGSSPITPQRLCLSQKYWPPLCWINSHFWVLILLNLSGLGRLKHFLLLDTLTPHIPLSHFTLISLAAPLESPLHKL